MRKFLSLTNRLTVMGPPVLLTREDPSLSEEVRRLAKRIAGDGASAEVEQIAGRIAESQVDLQRARQARQYLLTRHQAEVAANEALLSRPADQALIPKLRKAMANYRERKLRALDRYERRALSRRKFAIRAFDLVRRHRGKAPP